MRRVSAVLVLVVGITFIVLPFALSLFGRADAAEKLSSAVRPSMTSSGLAALRQDFDVAFAAGDEFISKTEPAVANALHLTPEQLSGFVHSNFPDLAAGLDRWYSMSNDARKDITTIVDHQRQFESADAIPTSSIPLTAGPWGFILAGAALIACGGFMLSSRALIPMLTALGVGLIAVVVPLAVSLPKKTSDTSTVFAAIHTVLSRQEVDGLQANLGTVGKMVTQLTGSAIPALENQLKMTPDQFNNFVASNFPAVAKGLGSFQPILTRMTARVGVMDAGVPLYASASKIPFTALPWLFIGPGALVVIVSLFALRARASGR